MKALVTGATGGLGRNLCTRLVRDGWSVVGTGRSRTAGEALADEGVSFKAAAIDDMKAIREIGWGCDAVFHCAALASPWGNVVDFHAANVMGTASAVEAAIDNGVPLVHVSTPSIYFDYRDRLGVREGDPLPRKQVNLYSRTKLEAEHLVDRAVAERGLKAVTIRPRGIFGPHDTALFPRVIAAGPRVPMFRGGEVLVDVTYVENVVEAMLLAASKAEALSGKKYNVTNGQPILIGDLLSLAFEKLGLPFEPRRIPYPVAKLAASAMECLSKSGMMKGEPKLTRYTAGVFNYHQTLDISAARCDLGYWPTVSLVDGITRYAEWRRANET